MGCKLLHSKGSHKQHEKTTYGMRENICKPCDWRWINFQNIQAPSTAQYIYMEKKKNKQKIGRRPE